MMIGPLIGGALFQVSYIPLMLTIVDDVWSMQQVLQLCSVILFLLVLCGYTEKNNLLFLTEKITD